MGKKAVLRWSLKDSDGEELESGKDKFSVHDGHNKRVWRVMDECEFYGQKRLFLTTEVEVNLVKNKKKSFLP